MGSSFKCNGALLLEKPSSTTLDAVVSRDGAEKGTLVSLHSPSRQLRLHATAFPGVAAPESTPVLSPAMDPAPDAVALSLPNVDEGRLVERATEASEFVVAARISPSKSTGCSMADDVDCGGGRVPPLACGHLCSSVC